MRKPIELSSEARSALPENLAREHGAIPPGRHAQFRASDPAGMRKAVDRA